MQFKNSERVDWLTILSLAAATAAFGTLANGVIQIAQGRLAPAGAMAAVWVCLIGLAAVVVFEVPRSMQARSLAWRAAAGIIAAHCLALLALPQVVGPLPAAVWLPVLAAASLTAGIGAQRAWGFFDTPTATSA